MWQSIILGAIIVAWVGATPDWDHNWHSSDHHLQHRPDRHYRPLLHRQSYAGSDFEKDEWICRNTKSGETITIQNEQQQETEPNEFGPHDPWNLRSTASSASPGHHDRFLSGRDHPHHHHRWNLFHGPWSHGHRRDSHEEDDEFDSTKKRGDCRDSGENAMNPKGTSYTTDRPRTTQNLPQMTAADEHQSTEPVSPRDIFFPVSSSSNTGGVGIIDVRVGSSSQD